jgi:hypothetical protein
VRSLVAVVANEIIELGLLLQEVFAGRVAGFAPQGRMRASTAIVA